MAQARFQAPQFNARAFHGNPAAVVPATQPDNKPEWHDRAANAHGDEAVAMDVTTKAVKRNMAILSAWLSNPAFGRSLSRDERIEMTIRRDAYRQELYRRGDAAKAKSMAHKSQGANGKAPSHSAQLH